MIRAQIDRNLVIDDLDVIGRNPKPPGERAVVMQGWCAHGTVNIVITGPDLERVRDVLETVMREAPC